jgi:hypothetical protein
MNQINSYLLTSCSCVHFPLKTLQLPTSLVKMTHFESQVLYETSQVLWPSSKHCYVQMYALLMRPSSLEYTGGIFNCLVVSFCLGSRLLLRNQGYLHWKGRISSDQEFWNQSGLPKHVLSDLKIRWLSQLTYTFYHLFPHLVSSSYGQHHKKRH